MLAVTSYKPAYVAACLEAIEMQLKAFRALPKGPERSAFEPLFFRHMVLALDHYFLHRQRSSEGKEGSPANEVRMLCNAIHDNAGVFAKDTQIKYDPARSVTGIKFGEEIALDEATFSKLAYAFFEDIAKRYP
jgi:hypothetical protein